MRLIKEEILRILCTVTLVWFCALNWSKKLGDRLYFLDSPNNFLSGSDSGLLSVVTKVFSE